MTKGEAINWIINLSADIGKIQHQELWHYEQALSEIREILEAQPERKTGRWIKISPADIYECSECGKNVMTADIDAYDFCHGCGSKMEVNHEAD